MYDASMQECKMQETELCASVHYDKGPEVIFS